MTLLRFQGRVRRLALGPSDLDGLDDAQRKRLGELMCASPRLALSIAIRAASSGRGEVPDWLLPVLERAQEVAASWSRIRQEVGERSAVGHR